MYNDIFYDDLIDYINVDILSKLNNNQIGGNNDSSFSSKVFRTVEAYKKYHENFKKISFDFSCTKVENIIKKFGITSDSKLFNITRQYIYRPINIYLTNPYTIYNSYLILLLHFILNNKDIINTSLNDFFNIDIDIDIDKIINSTIEFLYIITTLIMCIELIEEGGTDNIINSINTRLNALKDSVEQSLKLMFENTKSLFKNLFSKKDIYIYNSRLSLQKKSKDFNKDQELIFYHLVKNDNNPVKGGGEIIDFENIKNKILNFLNDYKSGIELDKLLNDLYNSFNIKFKKKEKSTNLTKTNYIFDKTSGTIKCFENIDRVLYLTPIENKLELIKLTSKNSKIKYYDNNNFEIDSISLILGKPVHTALVIAYIYSTKVKHPTNNYRFSLNPNGEINIYDIKTGKELASATLHIKKDSQDVAILKETCNEIFGNKHSDNMCNNYFYSILGRSAILLFKTLDSSIKENYNIENLLESANPAIQYEILKTLKFKKYSNGKICTISDWINTLNKYETEQYKNYLINNNQVKNIIEKIINNYNKFI